MKYLKENFPVFWSPKFYGLLLTVLAYYFNKYGFTFSPQALSEALMMLAGGATTIGSVDSVARKLAKKK